MRNDAWKRAAMLLPIALTMTLISACSGTGIAGYAGCSRYDEAQMQMPLDVLLENDPWGTDTARIQDRE